MKVVMGSNQMYMFCIASARVRFYLVIHRSVHVLVFTVGNKRRMNDMIRRETIFPNLLLITRARPSYNFGSFFHVRSQIAVWALKRMRREVSGRSALLQFPEHMESRSCCLKVYCRTDSMTSRELNEETTKSISRAKDH